MADQVTYQTSTLATPPSGTAVSTDDAGASGHVQRVKLAQSADGVATHVQADADGLLVNLGANNDVTLGAALPAGTNNIGDVDVLSSALPTGASTLAEQQSQTTHLATIAGDTTDIETAVELLDDTVATLGTTTYAEATTKGLVIGGIRRDADTSAVNTDNEIAPLQVDASGYLKVNVKASAASGGDGAIQDGANSAIEATVFDYTNSNPLAVRLTDTSGDYVGAGGGTQYDEDTASGAADKITMAGVVRKDTAATLVDTDGDRTQLQVDATGRLHVNGSGVTQPVSDASGSLTVDAADGTVFVRSAASGTFPVDIGRYGGEVVPTLGTTTYTEATSKGLAIAAVRRDADTSPVGTDNEFGPLTLDANGRLKVEVFDGGDSHTVDGTVAVSSLPALVAGTANIGDVDVLTLPALVAGTANIGDVDIASGPTGANALQAQGTVAPDSAAANNPLLNGGSRETMADSAPANRVSADADVERLSTMDGAVYVIPTGPQTFTLHATGVQTGAQIHAAPGAGLAIYITSISFSIGAATASSVKVLNNGGADVWGPHYLEAINGRGLHVTFPTPLKFTANTRADVTTTGATTQTVDINGFIGPG